MSQLYAATAADLQEEGSHFKKTGQVESLLANVQRFGEKAALGGPARM